MEEAQVFSTNTIGITGYTYAKKMNLNTDLHPSHKLTKMDHRHK